jgi:hypothetical protein
MNLVSLTNTGPSPGVFGRVVVSSTGLPPGVFGRVAMAGKSPSLDVLERAWTSHSVCSDEWRWTGKGRHSTYSNEWW